MVILSCNTHNTLLPNRRRPIPGRSPGRVRAGARGLAAPRVHLGLFAPPATTVLAPGTMLPQTLFCLGPKSHAEQCFINIINIIMMTRVCTALTSIVAHTIVHSCAHDNTGAHRGDGGRY